MRTPPILTKLYTKAAAVKDRVMNAIKAFGERHIQLGKAKGGRAKVAKQMVKHGPESVRKPLLERQNRIALKDIAIEDYSANVKNLLKEIALNPEKVLTENEVESLKAQMGKLQKGETKDKAAVELMDATGTLIRKIEQARGPKEANLGKLNQLQSFYRNVAFPKIQAD